MIKSSFGMEPLYVNNNIVVFKYHANQRIGQVVEKNPVNCAPW
jgi:hypothetical protein